MTEVSADRVHDLARAALVGQGFPGHLVDDVAREFVVAELWGERVHGLGKLVSLQLGSLEAAPQFEARGPVLTVDGSGANGFLLMRAVALRLAEQARRDGLGLAAIRNFSRYGALYPYTEILARDGLVGILMNGAGPAAVAPFGSVDPITGTNPLCVSFPTPGEPQTLDFATADMVWAEIRQATLEERPLVDGPFLDADGNVTTLPSAVSAVKAFGGSKGWALNLAIEVLTGAMVGAQSGLAVNDEFDCGALMIAVRPDATGADSNFPAAVAQLLDEVRHARPAQPRQGVRAPGDRRRDEMLPAFVDVAPTTIDLLERMAAGEKSTTFSSNPLLN
jgi:L-2-hydroxycarboxylate dehydrogenase (NAD+)